MKNGEKPSRNSPRKRLGSVTEAPRLGFSSRKQFFSQILSDSHIPGGLNEFVLDEDMTKSKGKDPLEGLGGPMTRVRARKAKEALQQVLSILFEYKPKFQGEKSKVVSCIMAQMEED